MQQSYYVVLVDRVVREKNADSSVKSNDFNSVLSFDPEIKIFNNESIKNERVRILLPCEAIKMFTFYYEPPLLARILRSFVLNALLK